MQVRAELNPGRGRRGTKVTVNDFIPRARSSRALREPKVNAASTAMRSFHYGDVTSAVAGRDRRGSLPRHCARGQNKSLARSARGQSLAHRARNKRMKPEEFQGGR